MNTDMAVAVAHAVFSPESGKPKDFYFSQQQVAACVLADDWTWLGIKAYTKKLFNGQPYTECRDATEAKGTNWPDAVYLGTGNYSDISLAI